MEHVEIDTGISREYQVQNFVESYKQLYRDIEKSLALMFNYYLYFSCILQ